MWQWIVQNAGTLLVCGVLAALFALLIVSRIRDKKRGRSCCGGSCGACQCRGACHPEQETEK